jgi:uncharacterized protein (TIGR02300 family)
VAKPEWGAKRICHNCGTRYYDLHRDPIVCPKCGTAFDPEAFLKSRRTRPALAAEPAPARTARAAPPDEVDEDVEAVEDPDTFTVDEEAETEEAAELEQGELPADQFAEDEEEAESDTEADSDDLIEDTSELGDEDVEEVVDLEDEQEEP